MGKRYLVGIIGMWMMAAWYGCSMETDMPADSVHAKLEVDIVPAETESRAVLESSSFPNNSQVGIQLVDGGGTTYNSISYHNIKATVASSKWTLASDVLLSTTSGTVYAYYPYSASVTDMTAIPVATSSQTDYMYATPATSISNSKTGAKLTMKHALSAVRVAIKKGTYTGTGKVTAVSVKGNTAGTTANLNARTGELSSVEGKGTAVSIAPDMTLTTTAKNADVIVVPTGTESTLTLSMTIDGKAYSVTTAAVKLVQGQMYKYVVTLDAQKMSVSSLSMNEWKYNDSGTDNVKAQCNLTLAGNMDGVAVNNTVSGSTVTIKATTYDAMKYVKEVAYSGTATVSQSIDYKNNCRTITVSDIKSNVTITFNGCSEYIDLRRAGNGVYVVADGYKGVPTADASSSCVAAALIVDDAPTPQRLMIEKNGGKNTTSIKAAYTADRATNTGYTYFYWGMYGSDNANITNYKQVGGGGTSGDGYLPKTDGTYYSTPHLSADYTTWTSGALSDFNGKANTTAIQAVKDTDSYTTYANMGTYCTKFNETPAENQGYSDWYIPSFGQLALIHLNMTEINKAFTAIGGATLGNYYHWSSSEYSSNYGWYVWFGYGKMSASFDKVTNLQVRFVRDI